MLTLDCSSKYKEELVQCSILNESTWKELELLVTIDSGSRVPGAAKIAGIILRINIGTWAWKSSVCHQRFRSPHASGPAIAPETDHLTCCFWDIWIAPFPGREAERRLSGKDGGVAYGPGVADMKAGLLPPTILSRP